MIWKESKKIKITKLKIECKKQVHSNKISKNYFKNSNEGFAIISVVEIQGAKATPGVEFRLTIKLHHYHS